MMCAWVVEAGGRYPDTLSAPGAPVWVWALRCLWLGGLLPRLSPSLQCRSALSCQEQRDTWVPLGWLQDPGTPGLGGNPGRAKQLGLMNLGLESVLTQQDSVFLSSCWVKGSPWLLGHRAPMSSLHSPACDLITSERGLGSARLCAGPVLARGQPSASSAASWACLGTGICPLGLSGRGLWALTALIWELGDENWLEGHRDHAPLWRAARGRVSVSGSQGLGAVNLKESHQQVWTRTWVEVENYAEEGSFLNKMWTFCLVTSKKKKLAEEKTAKGSMLKTLLPNLLAVGNTISCCKELP